MGILTLHNIAGRPDERLAILKKDGCELSEPQELFVAILVETHGDPCTTGCAYFKGGKCPAYQKYHSDAQDKRRAAEAKAKAKAAVPQKIFGQRGGPIEILLPCFNIVGASDEVVDDEGQIITPAQPGTQEFHGSVSVTSRRSKQLERPRFHSCKKCGRRYAVNMRTNPPVIKEV